MKLGELRTAIRKTKGNPLCTIALPDGTVLEGVGVQKTALLEALGARYGIKSTETGLGFDEDTMTIVSDVGALPASQQPDQDLDEPVNKPRQSPAPTPRRAAQIVDEPLEDEPLDDEELDDESLDDEPLDDDEDL